MSVRELAAYPIVFVAALAAVTLLPRLSFAQSSDHYVSGSDFGGIGLLQTRTARFAPDGMLSVGYSQTTPYERYLINFQPLPFVEATFRYTSVEDRDFQGNAFTGGGSSFKDRGADLKFRILEEGRFRPALALGLQDGLGTGLFSGEYLVASKRYYDFDFSFGIGWGYSAGSSTLRNPFLSISESFRFRDSGETVGGTPLPGNWFSGPNIGLFGGIEYATPIRGLSLKVEYDPNDYTSEPLLNEIEHTSHINFGFNYRPFPWIDIGLAYERGSTVMLHVSLNADLNASGIPKIDPPPPTLVVRPPRVPPETAAGAKRPEPEFEESRRLSPSNGAAPDSDATAEALLTGLQRIGVDVVWVAVEHGVATFGIEAEVPQEISAEAAELARSTLPLELSEVRFVPIGSGTTAVNEIAAGPNPVSESDQGAIALPLGRAVHASAVHKSNQEMAKEVFAELEAEGLTAEAINFERYRVTVYVTGVRYREIARNVGRAAIVAANNVGPEVEEIAIVLVSSGVQVGGIRLNRSQIEDARRNRGSVEEIWFSAEPISPDTALPPTAIRNPARYPAFSYSFRPAIRQHIGSAEQFYLYQAFLRLSATAELAPGFLLSAAVGKDLYNNFDKLETVSDSRLPRVRSDIRRYLQSGEDNVIRALLAYVWSPAPDLYARLSAGIFEEMYGGYGGEILYRPYGSRFAAGIDINYVRQRDFDQLFSFRDYTVTTGHLNLYYMVPFYDLFAEINVGQYLAGDRGATFQLSRRFDSGVRVGGFFTLTDVPFNVFGEGSFDKGFFISIPLDLFSVRSSTNAGVFAFRPLTRDGGQRVSVRPRLYDVVNYGNLGSLERDWDRLFD